MRLIQIFHNISIYLFLSIILLSDFIFVCQELSKYELKKEINKIYNSEKMSNFDLKNQKASEKTFLIDNHLSNKKDNLDTNISSKRNSDKNNNLLNEINIKEDYNKNPKIIKKYILTEK